MTKPFAHLLSGFVTMLSATSCSELGSTEFTVAVDSVSGPTSVAAQANLTQYLYGPLGPNLCSGVKSVEVERTENGADIAVIGTRNSNGNCPQMPAYMVGQPVTVAPPFPNPLVLRVRGAGGTWIERTIQVK